LKLPLRKPARCDAPLTNFRAAHPGNAKGAIMDKRTIVHIGRGRQQSSLVLSLMYTVIDINVKRPVRLRSFTCGLHGRAMVDVKAVCKLPQAPHLAVPDNGGMGPVSYCRNLGNSWMAVNVAALG
jgi:hypothetical protein